MLTDEEIQTLIEKARKVRENAFVPRSDHKIGACILTHDNEYFEGCNVENAISGLGTCAERSAVDHAVAHGKYQFKAIAVIDDELVYPCGACLQYMLEFHQIDNEEITIIVSDTGGNIKKVPISSLLPHGYLTQKHLNDLRKYKQ